MKKSLNVLSKIVGPRPQTPVKISTSTKSFERNLVTLPKTYFRNNGKDLFEKFSHVTLQVPYENVNQNCQKISFLCKNLFEIVKTENNLW